MNFKTHFPENEDTHKEKKKKKKEQDEEQGIMALLSFVIGCLVIGLGIFICKYAILNLIVVIVALIATMFTSSGISQRREYAADATAIRLIGGAEFLISALEKIANARGVAPIRLGLVSPLFINRPKFDERIFEHLFRFLFWSHPPMEKRIKRLRQMQWVWLF